MKRKLLSALIAGIGLAGAGMAQAQISGNVVKIGVLSDMSGLYADIGGPGSVAAAKMAVEDYLKASKSQLKVEVVSADHQNKPDVGSSIARKWYDAEGVDMIADVPTSSVALAVNQVAKEKGKAFVNSGAGSSDLTGKDCSPNTVHWTYDTWQLAHATGSAVVKNGGDSWYFLTADYAFGQALDSADADPAFLAAIRLDMLRFARLQLGSNDEAEDAVQEALAGALRNVASFRGDAALKSWIIAQRPGVT